MYGVDNNCVVKTSDMYTQIEIGEKGVNGFPLV